MIELSVATTPMNWADCYFIVHETPEQVWHTARRQYVPADDAGYLAWREAYGRYPPAAPDHAELLVTLSQVYPSGAPASADAVNAERDRRIFGGFSFQSVRFQSRLEDQKRIAGAGTLALAAVVGGTQVGDLRWHGGDSDFVWIAEDNSLVPMDAQTVIAFGQAAARHESQHVFAARALKDMTPIPTDFGDDNYWIV